MPTVNYMNINEEREKERLNIHLKYTHFHNLRNGISIEPSYAVKMDSRMLKCYAQRESNRERRRRSNRDTDNVLVHYTYTYKLIFQLCKKVNDLLNVLPFLFYSFSFSAVSFASLCLISVKCHFIACARSLYNMKKNFRFHIAIAMKNLWNATPFHACSMY